jgi:NAD(P)-dependent dehydrogenase (short-subunit alcohol dehydrogenase family)
VRDVAAYQALLASVARELGPVRVLVNNAGRDDRHAWKT